MRIGLQGYEIAREERPAANLVFLLDVSGSMKPHNKLPLVKQAMRTLVSTLRSDDRVAIVVYAGASGLVLDSTVDHDEVIEALERQNNLKTAEYLPVTTIPGDTPTNKSRRDHGRRVHSRSL